MITYAQSGAVGSRNFLFPNGAVIEAASSKLRLVSVGMAVRPSTSTALNEGEQMIAQYERFPDFPGPSTYSDLMNKYRLSKRCVIDPRVDCAISYHFGNHVLQDSYQTPGASVGFGEDSFGGLLYVASGVDAKFSAIVSIVCNWEVIPNAPYNSLLQVQASHCSFKARQLAANIESQMLTADFPKNAFNASPLGVSASGPFGGRGGSASGGGYFPSIGTVRESVRYGAQLMNALAYGASAGIGAYRTVTGALGYGGGVPSVPQIELA